MHQNNAQQATVLKVIEYREFVKMHVNVGIQERVL